MSRFLVLAFATALLVLPTAASAQTAEPSSCAEQVSTAAAVPASAGSDGSGGTPAVAPGPAPIDDGGSDTAAPADTTNGGTSSIGDAAVPISGGDVPLAGASQEPEPEPGPGEEQPNEPGGEPQEPTGEEPTGGEQPAGETGGGGGLPRTGLEALKLLLLGAVLLLVGARLRVLLKRRQERGGENFHETTEQPALGPDGLPEEPVEAYHQPEEEYDLYEDEHHLDERSPDRDEWTFPDPDEPAPTGLLPSTAFARRRSEDE